MKYLPEMHCVLRMQSPENIASRCSDTILPRHQVQRAQLLPPLLLLLLLLLRTTIATTAAVRSPFLHPCDVDVLRPDNADPNTQLDNWQ